MVTVYTDGASRGNPGPSGAGILIVHNNKEILRDSVSLKVGTNNVAEYSALLRALKKVKELGFKKVRCVSDSELMVKQLNGEYKVKNPVLKKLFNEVKELEREFDEVSYVHVKRENKFIRIVDELAKKASYE